MRVLVFGDSIGFGAWDSQGGWVHRIKEQCDAIEIADKHAITPSIYNLSIDGDKSAGVLARMAAETEARRWPGETYAIVIAIGINDSNIIPGEEPIAPETFADTMRQIAATAAELAQHVIFVGLNPVDETRTRPVWWVDVDYTNDRVQAFDTILRAAASEANAHYIPVYDTFTERLEQGEDLLIDGLHPNDAGHALIADLVKPLLDELVPNHPS